ncbi:MAG: GTP-binding protein, partial [Candidatus Puniceispirillaceae bacterium]
TLGHHQPHVPIITLLSDDADLAQLLVPDDDTDSQSHHVHPDHHTHDHMQDFNSIALVSERPVNRLAFSRICKQFSHLILRGKGIIKFEQGTMIWHQTGRHINFTPHPDSHDKPDDKDSRLIIIAIEQLDAVSDALHQLGFTSYHDSSA